jgi:hypothetical protein
LENLNGIIKLYFDKDNYRNNKHYEKIINKLSIFIYMLISVVVILNLKINKDEKIFEELLNILTQCNTCNVLENPLILTLQKTVK